MKLEEVTYYRLARGEDGRGHHDDIIQRPFTMALRWQPDAGDAEADQGWAVLRRLAVGDEVSERHFALGIAWLHDALYYYGGNPPEPYPGRNAEAAGNISELLEELTGVPF
jgi:hypothetical protein